MKIGIDIDGVLYDFVTSIHAYAERKLGRTLPRNFDRWGFFFDEWGLDWLAFCQLMEDGCAEGELYHRGELAEGAADVIRMLAKLGHEVIFATARGAYAEAATRAWLDSHGLYHELVVAAEDKTTLGLDVLLDDSPANIEAARAAGIRGVTFDQPWNRHVEGDRAYSWVGFGWLMTTLDYLQAQQRESQR